MGSAAPSSGVRVSLADAEGVRALLDAAGCLDRAWRPVVDGEHLVWPVRKGVSLPANIDIERIDVTPETWTAAPPPIDPHHRLREAVERWLQTHAPNRAEDHEALLNDLPQRWERLGDLVLLPRSAFASPTWKQAFSASEQRPWAAVAAALRAERLGQQAFIAPDVIRSSNATMLLGASGEVEVTDHGVCFHFDVTRQMYSSGNVTERHRMGGLDLRGETVVDAFSGIGYYTLPMLVRGGAKHVHACDINPDAAAWLLKGAQANGVVGRLTQHVGDNRTTLPALRGVADRVVLGLLPTSEHAWEHAVGCLKPGGGWLHVHMNVEEEHIETWAEKTAARLGGTVGHVERVKWYAPRVRHVVLDVHVS
tara:strand:- start:3156 stop:4253 length:1098 start_codon:yes stop_codon:yes gene_type:complete